MDHGFLPISVALQRNPHLPTQIIASFFYGYRKSFFTQGLTTEEWDEAFQEARESVVRILNTGWSQKDLLEDFQIEYPNNMLARQPCGRDKESDLDPGRDAYAGIEWFEFCVYYQEGVWWEVIEHHGGGGTLLPLTLIRIGPYDEQGFCPVAKLGETMRIHR